MARVEGSAAHEGQLLNAVAFAARVHKGQIRKDGKTPYVSHVFRVCFILRNVFEITDHNALAAALLHDTIEDTTTDFDEIAEEFGEAVARYVAALTKDGRLPEEKREAAYCAGLSRAPWQVKVCKLADIYDNLQDSQHLSTEHQRKTQGKARRYLTALSIDLSDEAIPAWKAVDSYLNALAGESPHKAIQHD